MSVAFFETRLFHVQLMDGHRFSFYVWLTVFVFASCAFRLTFQKLVCWSKFDPDVVIDIATLTGACIVALGHHNAGLLSNHQPLADALLKAGRSSGDGAWQLPLDRPYRKQLKSNFLNYIFFCLFSFIDEAYSQKTWLRTAVFSIIIVGYTVLVRLLIYDMLFVKADALFWNAKQIDLIFPVVRIFYFY